MATTPFFLWATQASSSAAVSDPDTGGFGGALEESAVLSPELAAVVARPRLPSKSSGTGKQQQEGGAGKRQAGGGGGATSKKPPQRGLGVAELERLRCGGDPLCDLNAAVAAAAMADAAPNGHGHSVVHRHPAFDAAATGGRYYAPLLVRPSPPAPPPTAPPLCYVHSSSSGGQSVALEHQFLRERWGSMAGMGGFAPASNGAGAGHHQPLPPPPLAPEHPSSQSNTIWRPASSSCLHAGHRCDLCCKTMRALAERGARIPTAAANTTVMPDYSIYDLAAAMATARKEKGQGFLGRERISKEEVAAEKEVREIEFFPTSSSHRDESEFVATRSTTPFSSSASGGGGCAAVQLDLSLRL